MTVKEIFEKEKITDSLYIQNHFGDSAYLFSAQRFLTKNWNVELKDLTLKQKNWIEKILDDCVEHRIENR